MMLYLTALSCLTGEYLGQLGRCLLCDPTCYKCTGPENTDCMSCGIARYFDDGRCAIQCPPGKYSFVRQCHLCHHTCHTCSDGGTTNCTSCDKDKFGTERYLFDGECVDACPEGHYHSVRKTCEACGENCHMCSTAERCHRCRPSYYPEQGVCVRLQCGEGEVEDVESEDCVSCEEGCKSCRQGNPKHCLSCMDAYYQFGDMCYKNCPESTYNEEKTKTCQKCEEHCVTCDESECYWCADDYFLSDEECVLECDEGFYGDEESQECEPCHRDCKTCGGPNYDDCDSCEDDLQLKYGQCVTKHKSCDQGKFLNEKGRCAHCHSSCKQCSGPERNNCTVCEMDRFLTAQQACVSQCPEGSFGNVSSGHCEECSLACVSCKEKSQCLQCQSGPKVQMYLQDGRCVRHCDRGFPVAGVCQSCAPACHSCEYNATHCHSCLEPHVLYEHECRDSCPRAHFTRLGECQPCPLACSHCTEDGLCTDCDTFYFLHEDGCVDDCPLAFYADIERKECVPCHTDCSACDGPDEDDCEACKNPAALRHNGECVSQCPQSTYHDMDTMECRDCDNSCLACSGPLANACLSCRNNMKLDNHGHCVFFSKCPTHTYREQEGGCKACHTSCSQCTGPSGSQCLSCSDGYFLLNETCVQLCPSGFYSDQDQRVCERCHITCATCRGRHSQDCVACQPHLYRLGRSCTESCGPGHYVNGSALRCERCSPACELCDGAGDEACVSCRDTLFLLRRRCYHSCPQGSYSDIERRMCERCHPTCNTCTGSSALSCTSCYMGYSFLSGICVSECSVGEYASSVSPSLQCESCHQACTDCRGPGAYNCTVCPALQLLADDGRCLTCCVENERQENEMIPWECCNCTHSQDRCVLSVNFEFRAAEENVGRPALFITSSILLILSVGAGVFLFMRSRSKETPKTKPGGYEKLNNSGGSPSKAMSSYQPSRSEQLVEFRDGGDEDEDEEEDEDIVYMGQDGTVYRKFKYGVLDDDEEDELEYDDESYSYR